MSCEAPTESMTSLLFLPQVPIKPFKEGNDLFFDITL